MRLSSIDDPEPRRAYVKRLKEYYRPHFDRLSEDSRRRFDRNPLRMLDSKDERDQALKERAPKLIDQLSDAPAGHQAAVQDALTNAGIPFTIDPLLVRGLDYYNRTVFEIVPTGDDRAQGTIGGGGRYDGLVEVLGGPPTPGMGFGCGLERVILEMERDSATGPARPSVEVFVVHRGTGTARAALRVAGDLRASGWATVVGEGERSFRSQMRSADASGARVAILLGEDELARGAVVVKDLRGDGLQAEAPLGAVVAAVGDILRPG